MSFSFANWFIRWIGKWLTSDHPPKRAYLCDFERITYEVKPGDVLLLEGRNRISRIIQKVTLSPWSHATLYIGRLHDIEDPIMRKLVKRHFKNPANKQLLIESLIGRGTFIRELEHYRHDHLRICRPQGLARQDAQTVISFAIRHLGMEYSIRHIFDLFRFLFPWSILPRRWRSSLFEHNALKPTEEICSSMIAKAFGSINFPILPLIKKEGESYQMIRRNPHLFTPSDFDYSPYFAIIKYPMLSITEPTPYRQLPWKYGELSNDEDSNYLLPQFDAEREIDIFEDKNKDKDKTK